MSIVETLRTQHERLAAVAGNLRRQLNVDHLTRSAGETRTLLSSLVGLLRVHLSAEDKVLYPRLMESADPNVRETAKRFVDEMGGLSNALAGFVRRWPHPGSIAERPDQFIHETAELLDALETRIRSEEAVLYPMLIE